MRLRAGIEMRGREVDWLKTKSAEDGSLFDIAKTKQDQIACIVLENVRLARTRNIRNALNQDCRAQGAGEVEAGELSSQTGRLDPGTDMGRLERIRAVRRVVSLLEGLIAAFDEVADELAQMEDEVADAAMLSTVSDRLASAKVAADAALAMLRQWAKDADANDDGDARGR
jgi:hypothetical protein